MSNKFAQDVIKELNNFRSNPKSIQHQCELIRKGLSRLKGDDPFLKEIDTFIQELKSLKPLPQLKYNVALSEAAKNELPNFRGRDNYQKIKRSNNLKGIVPDFYLEANPTLVADDGADEPINVLTKTLLNKFDKSKEGRAILCDPSFTQVVVAQEIFDEENMVILIFATKHCEKAPEPIKSSKNEFIMNIQYHETKDIKKPKYETYVHHLIKGDIFGADNIQKSSYQKEIFSQGGNRPILEQRGLIPQTLKSNKSEMRMIGSSSLNTRFPTTVESKKSKFEQTSVKRRNEGIGTKTETRTESKTTSSGLRGLGGGSRGIQTSTTTSRTVSSIGGGSSSSGSSKYFKRF